MNWPVALACLGSYLLGMAVAYALVGIGRSLRTPAPMTIQEAIDRDD